MQGQKLLKVNEVAEILGLGRLSTYQLCHRADFPALRLGRAIRVPADALDEWIRRQLQRAESRN